MRGVALVILLVCWVGWGFCSSNSPIFVGGLFETIGSSQNLHSFGEYFPSNELWVNLENSAVLSTGTAQSIALLESSNSEYRGLVVGGVFNYLNHTANTISFGNIAFYNESSGIWQPLGWGCDGPVNALTILPISSSDPDSNCTSINPCYTVVAAGHFDVCFQGDEERTTISYPDGFGFFDLSSQVWYKPINQSLPDGIEISSVSVSPDYNDLYLAGNSENGNITMGWAFRSPIIASTVGQVSYLQWDTIATTQDTSNRSVINIIVPGENYCYICGLYDTLISNGSTIEVNNIAYYSNGILDSLGGTDGEIVTGTLVTTIQPNVLYVAGTFTTVGHTSKSALGIARWSAPAWDNVGSGIQIDNEYTTALGAPFLQLGSWGSDVIIGGAIKQAGGIPVNNVALWNGAKWSSLGDDSNFSHYRMLPFSVSSEGTIFFAAQGLQNSIFEDIIIDGYPLVENLMVEYDISSATWENYNYNELLLDGVVLDMEFYDENTLVVAGGFRKVGNITNLNNLVLLEYPRLNWSSFDGGVYGLVTSLQVVDTSVYVGGVFQFIGNTTKYASVAKYCPDEGWTNVGNGISLTDPNSVAKRPTVYDLALSADSKYLYASGAFVKSLNSSGTMYNVTSVVAWDIEAEEWLPIQLDLQGVVFDLEVDGNNLYMGGNFIVRNGNTTYNNFALLQTNGSNVGTWGSVVAPCSVAFDECSSQTILTIALNPTVPPHNATGAPIYIGGVISNIQGNVINGLAQLVDDTWVSFGSGVTGGFPFVMSLALTYDYSSLYVGGSFSSANSVPVNDIVAWSISKGQFSALAPVEGWSGFVFDILPTFANVTTDSYGENTDSGDGINPITIGLVLSLAVIIICLVLVIFAIVVAIVVYRPKDVKRFPNPEDTSLTQTEKETWEDFYSYEWEISYNLLEISEAVGRGRNGVVHHAAYKGQHVAVKIFNTEIAGTYYAKDNVCKYASMMRALKHPNIVHMVGACSDPLCLVTEFGELGCLSDIIRISPSKLTWSRVKSIALEAARGMSFLHGQEPSFLHQNLTSNNVIVNEFWSIKIGDAGLSGILKESGEYKISPAKRWTAPEVLLGRPYTAKADVYSFGMILYHMITQSLPFSQEEKEMNVTLTQLVIRGVRPIINVDDIPQQFIEIMQSCWNEDPDYRPPFTSILTMLNNIPDDTLE